MAQMRLLLTLLIFLYCLSCLALGGQERIETINIISRSDGLGGESVHRMIKDHAGHLWMMTRNGVSTFNGKRILTYNIPDEEGRNLLVLSICESADRTIYVGTAKGLYALRYGSNKLTCVLPGLVNVENMLADGNTIYLGCKDGLHIYDGKNVRKVEMGQHNYLEYLPRHFQKLPDGTIWFSTRYVMYAYHPKTGALKSYKIAHLLPYNTVLGTFAFVGDKLFLGTRNSGLFVMDKAMRNVRRIGQLGNVISNIHPTHDGKLCVGTESMGAFVIDVQTETILEHYGTLEQGNHKIPTDVVNDFMRGADGVNLFGFTRSGLGYTYYHTDLFKTYAQGDFTTRGLDVRCFYHHGTESLIGTQKGLYYVEETSGRSQYIKPEGTEGGLLVISILYYEGNYYVGTYDAGLLIFDPKTKTMRKQNLHPLLNFSTVSMLQVAPDGNLWIGSSEGLFILDKQGGVTRYAEQNSRICGGSIRSTVFDHAGNAWIAAGTGMCIYVPTSKTFETSTFPQGFFHKLQHLDFSMGHNRTVYASDMTTVYFSDEKMEQFGTLPIPPKVTEDVCRQFLDDNKGNFWMATEKGLFSADYDFSEISHFGYSEGITGTNINRLSLDADGTLWVCTSDGLVSANIRQLSAHGKKSPCKVQLYNIRKGGELIDRGTEAVINDKTSLSVHWNLTSTILSFLPLLPDYSKQQGRLYEYRLDGEKQWHLILDGEEVTVSDLFLGNHHLKVRLAGTPGTESNYTISVIPSLLAILEAIFLVIAVILYFAWRRYHKTTRILLAERNEIEGALIEVEQQRQDAEMQVAELQEAVQEKQQETTVETQKYSKVKLNEEECAEVVTRMKEYIEHNQVYTNPDLKMSDLAEVLGLSASKLSQIFNLYVKENYYDFINRYRLDEFKRRIEAEDYKRYTLTAISEKCGFKKSSFFSTFRKVEGMTPTEYLKKRQ